MKPGRGKHMKAIGEKCGWVIPKKERRLLKLLRVHTCECEHEFVAQSPTIPRRKAAMRIHVEFAREEVSAFGPQLHMAKTLSDKTRGH
jgi:hypothetical protein